ncbi:MAG: hypothetical protein J7456_06670, partial [Chloroflexus sp.]|nr:hypothetical protein [Chloroflexus sp.]
FGIGTKTLHGSYKSFQTSSQKVILACKWRSKVKKFISTKLAANILLAIYGLLVIFHLLVLAQVIPPDIVWGGQIGDSPTELVVFEMIALITVVFFAVTIAIKVDYIKVGRFKKVFNILLWIIFIYALLNIIGNFLSISSIETLLFLPVSIVVALLVFRLAIEKS